MNAEPVSGARSFAVAWRNRLTGVTSKIGELSAQGDEHRFHYLPSVGDVDGFRPLLGFSDLGLVYVSRPLFPIFAQRIMDPGRPDYPDYLRALGLHAAATGLEVLGRTGGYRKADSIHVAENPRVQPDGATSHIFFVSGFKYANDERGLQAPSVDMLHVGARLAIEPEPDNRINQRALQLTIGGGVAIGWIPELLLEYVRTLVAGGSRDVEIMQVNGADFPAYLRVLVKLAGSLPGHAGPAFDLAR